VVRVLCFAAGQLREIPVKVLRSLYWRKAGADLPLQVVVIKPLGYRLRNGSKLLYRQPALLICTDLDLDLQTLDMQYADCHNRRSPATVSCYWLPCSALAFNAPLSIFPCRSGGGNRFVLRYWICLHFCATKSLPRLRIPHLY
jgi:hypothetical protein